MKSRGFFYLRVLRSAHNRICVPQRRWCSKRRSDVRNRHPIASSASASVLSRTSSSDGRLGHRIASA
eukprot:3764618-Rhodomonas_salina.2